MVEITARKTLEAERATAEDRFRRVVEDLPAIVYLESVDHEPGQPNRMLYVSPQVEDDPRLHRRGVDAPTRSHGRASSTRRTASGSAPSTTGSNGRAASSTPSTGCSPATASVRWIRDTASLVRDDARRPAVLAGHHVRRHRASTRARRAPRRPRSATARSSSRSPWSSTSTRSAPAPPCTSARRPSGSSATPPQAWYDDPSSGATIVHPDDQARLDAQPEIDAPTATAYRIIAKDGREVWVHDTSSLIADEEGRPRYWQGVLVDVTREHERAELERELDRERAEAERLRLEDEMRTTFLRAVSHDLRTPLAAILGLSLTLGREDARARRPRSGPTWPTRIAQNARKLDGMVADFLDLERLERGLAHPELAPVDVGALVRELVGELRPRRRAAARARRRSALGPGRPGDGGADRREPARQHRQAHARRLADLGAARADRRGRAPGGRGRRPRGPRGRAGDDLRGVPPGGRLGARVGRGARARGPVR